MLTRVSRRAQGRNTGAWRNRQNSRVTRKTATQSRRLEPWEGGKDPGLEIALEPPHELGSRSEPGTVRPRAGAHLCQTLRRLHTGPVRAEAWAVLESARL